VSEGEAPDGPSPHDAIREAQAQSADQRLWIRALIPILEAYHHEPAREGRVQDAFDSLFIATCARLKRILGSDPPLER
jgi:hypothetical protein